MTTRRTLPGNLIIDFGRARKAFGQNRDDIVKMLLLFFTPKKDRNYRYEDWIFGDWMGDYDFSYDKPRFRNQKFVGKRNTLYLYVEPFDKAEDGFYHKIHYMIKDSSDIFQHGEVNLDELKLGKLPHINVEDEEDETFWSYHSSFGDVTLIKKSVLEESDKNGHTISETNRNQVLYDLLKDPTAFYKTSVIPDALDIAELLTLCRLQLEQHQDFFVKRSPGKRLETIHMLNSVSAKILDLFKQLYNMSEKDDNLVTQVKKYIVLHLISKKDESENIPQFVTSNHNLKHSINDIIMDMNQARELWIIKNTPVLQEPLVPEPQLQAPETVKPEPVFNDIEVIISTPVNKKQDEVPSSNPTDMTVLKESQKVVSPHESAESDRHINDRKKELPPIMLQQKTVMEENQKAGHSPEPETSRKAWLVEKINLAILGVKNITDAKTAQPDDHIDPEHSYLKWMEIHASGTRFFTRWSHFFHGDSGRNRARELLVFVNDSCPEYRDILVKLKEVFSKSSHTAHSLRSYLHKQGVKEEILEEELGMAAVMEAKR